MTRPLLLAALGLGLLSACASDAGIAYQAWYVRQAADLPRPAFEGGMQVVEQPLPDGTTLVADLFLPEESGPAPTIVVRNAYARELFRPLGRAFAQQGFACLIQDVRGTGGSEGDFIPMQGEREDGAATLAWVRAQPWSNGELFGYGPSYLTYNQWAMAVERPEGLRGIAALEGTAELRDTLHGDGPFNQDLALGWALYLRELTQGPKSIPELMKLQGLYDDLPWAHAELASMDVAAFGERDANWQRFLVADAQDPYWVETDLRPDLPEVEAAVWMSVGWHDFSLEDSLDAYAALREAGKEVHLTLGPWAHGDERLMMEGLQPLLAFFDAQRDQPSGRFEGGAALRYHVSGVDEWVEAEVWPPPTRRLSLHLGQDLQSEDPAFRYDPADPPRVEGGHRIFGGEPVVDNRELAEHPGVSLWLGEPLEAPLRVLGAPTLELAEVGEAGDVFARLLRVDTRGRMWNVSDGITRVSGDTARVELRPTAVEFGVGERVGLIISGGSWPVYAPNREAGVVELGLEDGALVLPQGM